MGAVTAPTPAACRRKAFRSRTSSEGAWSSSSSSSRESGDPYAVPIVRTQRQLPVSKFCPPCGSGSPLFAGTTRDKSRSFASLPLRDRRRLQRRADVAREFLGVVIGPEVNEEHAGLLVQHVA